MNRLIFLVDGFNVYHSVRASQKLTGNCVKWLNLFSLCSSYTQSFGKDAILESIFYFSALPTHLIHRDPGKVARYRTYARCLRSTGIDVVSGRFKQKDTFCNKCSRTFLRYEEKETDVAIATKLFRCFITEACDTAVIVSGDTDLSPAIKECLHLFPQKTIAFMFPYERWPRELSKLSAKVFRLMPKHYARHQFPDPVVLSNGEKIYKPSSW